MDGLASPWPEAGLCDRVPECRTKEVRAWITGDTADDRFTGIQYPAVCLEDSGDVLPTQEGTIQDGTYIDRDGNPELMAVYAQHYLSAYRTAMPTGGLPRAVVEVMPALHMLLIAAELALKADLIRSGKKAGNIHALADLYRKLESPHRAAVDDMFARCDPVVRLRRVRASPPSVQEVLEVYGDSYRGESKVYLDTRYYAEPGLSMVKSSTPYPVFLPDVVEAVLGAFRFFDGAARLERLGADLQDASVAYRRKWDLVPASLGLAVVGVSKESSKDVDGRDAGAFKRWCRMHPPGLDTSWGYGGTTLLFYRAEHNTPLDGQLLLDGIECRIWRRERIEIHSRDLYALADALECEGSFNTLRTPKGTRGTECIAACEKPEGCSDGGNR